MRGADRIGSGCIAYVYTQQLTRVIHSTVQAISISFSLLFVQGTQCHIIHRYTWIMKNKYGNNKTHQRSSGAGMRGREIIILFTYSVTACARAASATV